MNIGKMNRINKKANDKGIFIYLGAFTTKAKAQEFVDRLNKENFSAYIYPLD
jgi:cell division septation protein DedD